MRVLFACLLSIASQADASAWDRLAGRWSGTGEVRGMTADIELEFRITLDGKGRHLGFQNRMTARDGKVWTFRAEALYLCDAAGACSGHWYDSRGMLLPLRAVAAADQVVVDWGDTATEVGRTTYRLAEDGALEITDEVQGKDAAWRVFGRTRLMRDD